MKRNGKIGVLVGALAVLVCAVVMVKAEKEGRKGLGKFTSISEGAGYVEAAFANGTVRFSMKEPGLLRVRATAAGEFEKFESFAVDPASAAEKAPAYEDKGDTLLIDAGLVKLSIDKKTGRMDALDEGGNVIVAEPDGGGAYFNGDEVGCVKQAPKGERYFGFGEKTGPLNKRGRRMTMWNSDMPHSKRKEPLYQSHPMFLAVKAGRAYGIFFDNTFRSEFDMAASNESRYEFSAAGGELNYWVMAGPQPKDVLARYGRLVGTMKMPPLWGLGFHQCRWSYEDEEWVREVWGDFKKNDIPLDAIYLDIHYMRGYRVFTFDKERFPDPRGLFAEMKADGVRTVVIVDPGVKIDDGYTVYEEGLEKGYYALDARTGKPFEASVWPGPAYFPDFYRPEVRQWWGGWHKFYTDLGVAGIWNDMNEPAGWGKSLPVLGYFVPLTGVDWLEMRHGQTPGLVPHARIHNVYANLEAQATYEGLLAAKPDERPFVISRAGYAGLPRYSLIWTGDNYSTWGSLQTSVPMLQNMGLSGLAWAGADIGGFGGYPSRDLFARWIQVGVFSPFTRDHTSNSMPDQEPYQFGKKVTAISREYINLRYRLLPYTYALFEESTRTNAPIMRAMVYEFPGDEKAVAAEDQFMWGPSFLAAPVLKPGAMKRDVYLPAGTWYCFYSKQLVPGGFTIKADAPLGRMPLYVRAGAIVPMAPKMNRTGEKPWDPLTIEVYRGDGESSFTLYEDDKESNDYLKGEWSKTPIVFTPEGKGGTLTIGPSEGDFDPGRKSIEIKVYGAPGAQFTAASGDGCEDTLMNSGANHDGTLTVLLTGKCRSYSVKVE